MYLWTTRFVVLSKKGMRWVWPNLFSACLFCLSHTNLLPSMHLTCFLGIFLGVEISLMAFIFDRFDRNPWWIWGEQLSCYLSSCLLLLTFYFSCSYGFVSTANLIMSTYFFFPSGYPDKSKQRRSLHFHCLIRNVSHFAVHSFFRTCYLFKKKKKKQKKRKR